MKNSLSSQRGMVSTVFGGAVLALLFFSPRLFAASTSTSLGSTANVVADCKVTNTPSVKFGAYNSGTGNTATATISVECANGTTATIGLDQGTNVNNASSCGTTRAMNNPAGKFLCYDLYTNATYTTVWNTNNTVSLNFTAFGILNTTVYGKVPAGQSPTAGAYDDFVGIIVSF